MVQRMDQPLTFRVSGVESISNRVTMICCPSHSSQLRLEISLVSGLAMPLTKKILAVCAKMRRKPLTCKDTYFSGIFSRRLASSGAKRAVDELTNSEIDNAFGVNTNLFGSNDITCISLPKSFCSVAGNQSIDPSKTLIIGSMKRLLGQFGSCAAVGKSRGHFFWKVRSQNQQLSRSLDHSASRSFLRFRLHTCDIVSTHTSDDKRQTWKTKPLPQVRTAARQAVTRASACLPLFWI